jgi:hypothetical protein
VRQTCCQGEYRRQDSSVVLVKLVMYVHGRRNPDKLLQGRTCA